MKLFISQPMKGKSEEEILSERRDVVAHCKERYGEDIHVIDNYFEDWPNCKQPSLFFLGRSIELLADADVAYFVRGWEEARGCQIENACAIEYGIEVVEDYRKGA